MSEHAEEQSRPEIQRDCECFNPVVANRKEIIIDEYEPQNPSILWDCDNCDNRHPITAQFQTGIRDEDGNMGYITLCETCLFTAIDGIGKSYRKGVELDESE